MNNLGIKKPIISEKSFAQAANGVYVFQIAKNTNKHTVAKQVEKLFKVKVVKVNIVNTVGKIKKVGKKIGRRADIKKAYVSISKGQKINIFETEEKNSKKEEIAHSPAGKQGLSRTDKLQIKIK